MKKTLFLSLLATVAMLLSSCAVNLGGTMANYNMLPGNYIPHNPQSSTLKLVIHNRQDFEAVFGNSAGSIDFAHKFVVAVILPTTNRQTQVEAVACNRIGDRLYYSYLVTEGHATGYTYTPYAAVVVDRSEPIDVVFQRVTYEDLESAGIHRTGSQPGNTTPRPRL